MRNGEKSKFVVNVDVYLLFGISWYLWLCIVHCSGWDLGYSLIEFVLLFWKSFLSFSSVTQIFLWFFFFFFFYSSSGVTGFHLMLLVWQVMGFRPKKK
jgi:hypothetical protein